MKAIFIIGTGRSGTHFLTRVLNGFSNIYDPLDGKENTQILRDVAQSAILHRPINSTVVEKYKEFSTMNSKIYLDQHHPNIFFVEEILKLIPDAVFLYPDRPVYQIVSSMLQHNGIMSWYSYATSWKRMFFNRVPFPNRFLGLDSIKQINGLPPHLLCAHRAIAHKKVFLALADRWPGKVRAVNYESLVDSPLDELEKVFSREELNILGEFTLKEKPNKVSMSKYKDTLTDIQVSEIVKLQAGEIPTSI